MEGLVRWSKVCDVRQVEVYYKLSKWTTFGQFKKLELVNLVLFGCKLMAPSSINL